LKNSLTSKQFNFKTDCFFCGELITFGKKRKSYDVLPVKSVKVNDTVLGIFLDRSDFWADAVQSRILSVHDLHVYHKVCDVNFRTKKQIPAAHEHGMNTSKRAMVGCPKGKDRTEAFLEVTSYLEENDDEQITVTGWIRALSL